MTLNDWETDPEKFWDHMEANWGPDVRIPLGGGRFATRGGVFETRVAAVETVRVDVEGEDSA